MREASLAPARTRSARGTSREGAPGTVGRRASRAAVRGRVVSVGGEGKVSEGENAREVPNLERVPRNDVRGVARWSPGAARSTAREEATMTS